MCLCIYCGRAASRVEGDHCLPAIFGEFPKAPQLMQICRDCDSAIGRVEQSELLGDSPEAIARFQANPQTERLKRRAAARFHGTMCVEVGTAEAAAKHSSGGDVEVLDFLRFRDAHGNDIRVDLYPGMSADSIWRVLAKRGLGSQPPTHYMLSDELHAVVQRMWPSARLTDCGEIGPGTTRVPITTRHALTKDYWRALAKIAFHHLLCEEPQFSGTEDAFVPIRRFIRYGTDDVPFASVSATHWPGYALIGPAGFAVPTGLCHVIGVGTVADELVGYVRLFTRAGDPAAMEHRLYLVNRAPRCVPIRCLAYCYADDGRTPSHIERLRTIRTICV